MKVLFIGGTGIISSACSQLAVERGIELYLINRGQTARPVPEAAHVLHADVRDKASVNTALGTRTFDVIVNWIAFTPEHIETNLWLVESILGAKAEVNKDLVKIQGVGYSSGNSRTN